LWSLAVCATCGTESPMPSSSVPPEARPSGPKPLTPRKSARSSRFCLLTSSAPALMNWTPENVRAALQLYHQRLKQEIEGFGGKVEKFIGVA
jgi:class 3 adenylate cyclase